MFLDRASLLFYFFMTTAQKAFHGSHPCSCGAPQSMKTIKGVPSREGQAPQALGWVGRCGRPTPAACTTTVAPAATPSMEKIFMPRCGVTFDENCVPLDKGVLSGGSQVATQQTSCNFQKSHSCRLGGGWRERRDGEHDTLAYALDCRRYRVMPRWRAESE
jgi:hypothetical protein